MFESFKVPAELMPTDPRFGVGPSLIPVETVEKLAKTGHNLLGTSHRKAAVMNVVKEIQEGLRSYFKLPSDYEIILGNGGATLFWDMMGFGMVEKSSLHYVMGEFSDKCYRSFQQFPWIEAKAIKVEFGKGINPKFESGHDMICCTLNETSTGVMSQFPENNHPDVLMAIDATSGAGQIKIDFEKSDVYYFSPQKVFASEGGLYVAILSPKAIARIHKISQDKSRFIPESLKLTHPLEYAKKHQTYNTPSVSSLYFMNEQLKIMNQLGEDKVIELAQRKAEMIYSWAESRPYLSPFIQDKEFRSQAVATIDLDSRYNVGDLIISLRSQNAVYDIDGYHKLGRNQFRISLFHNVSYENLEKLTKIIDLAVTVQR